MFLVCPRLHRLLLQAGPRLARLQLRHVPADRRLVVEEQQVQPRGQGGETSTQSTWFESSRGELDIAVSLLRENNPTGTKVILNTKSNLVN